MSIQTWTGVPTGPAIYAQPDSVVDRGWRIERGRYGAREGVLFSADAGPTPGSLHFTPSVTGLHAIRIGVFSPAGKRNSVYVRLDNQPHFTNLQSLRHEPAYESLYFMTTDLTGRSIEIAPLGRDVCLDFVELVPVNRPPLPAATGKVIGILDFADDADWSRPTGFEAGSAIRRHADAGYDMVMWKAYAVRCEYHTAIGEVRGHSAVEGAGVAGDHLAGSNASIGDLLRRYDTMRQAVEIAHQVGMPIHGWARINNEFSRPNHQFSPDTPFHRANPDKVIRYKDGRATTKLSFAYPEVRRYKVDLLREIASYGMDGIFIDVLRHPPLVLYDLPLVEAYINAGGPDPRTLDGDGDEAWLRFRAEHSFTLFLREVREMLNELGAASGRRIALTIRTVDQPWYNLLIGCDVQAWMDQRLVDGVIFGPWCAAADNYPIEMDLRPYIAMAGGRAEVYGQVWRYGSVLHAEAMAASLYEQGVNGVALYESNATVAMSAMRERLWRMSRPNLLATRA